MVELDENGWAPIHHAAVRNYVTSVERFVETSGTEQLDIKTEDGLGNTPLLLAVSSASQQTVDVLVKLGADTTAVNSQRHGVVELCALHGHIDLLRYFVHLRSPQLNVHKSLILFLDSNNGKEALCAGSVIAAMTKNTCDASNSRALSLIEEGVVPVLLHMLGKNIGVDAKEHALNILTNILKYGNVKEQIIRHNGFQVLISLIKEGPVQLLLSLMNVVNETASEEACADALYSANAVAALVQVIASADSTNILDEENREDILLSAVHSLGLMAETCAKCKDAMGRQEFLSVLVNLFKESESRKLLMAWGTAVASIIAKHQPNQDALVKENGAVPLIQMAKSKHKDMQICAIKLLNRYNVLVMNILSKAKHIGSDLQKVFAIDAEWRKPFCDSGPLTSILLKSAGPVRCIQPITCTCPFYHTVHSCLAKCTAQVQCDLHISLQ